MATRTLYVRNVPVEVYEHLKRGARAAGLSMNRYVLELLGRETREKAGDDVFERVRKMHERWRAEGYVPPTREEIIEWIGRDEH